MPSAPHLSTGLDFRNAFGVFEERRRAERFAAIGVLEAVRLEGDGESAAFELSLVDESETGAALETPSPVAPGDRLRVRAQNGADTWREGVVVRCMPRFGAYRVGLRYDDAGVERVAA